MSVNETCRNTSDDRLTAVWAAALLTPAELAEAKAMEQQILDQARKELQQ